MSAWHERTIEERNLLNPAFCSVVLWNLANGYEFEASKSNANLRSIPIGLSYVGASLVLRGNTRLELPKVITTSIATWISENPLQRSAVAKGVVILRPYVREALMFGLNSAALELDGLRLRSRSSVKKAILGYLKRASRDVKDCTVRAQFVGRWLYRGGTPNTVMSLFGVRA